ncbi:hypothetical protein, partial [Streptococcus anginosus]|uniref:hypothetical protein n=1 Tax=Streptococcus anginosus TaxID=1328 RepID=UPI002ED8796D
LFHSGFQLSTILYHHMETEQQMTQLTLLGLGQYPNFLSSLPPKSITLRQQEAILRKQCPIFQKWDGG